MNNNENNKCINLPPKAIINEKIYLFLHCLIGNIIIKEKRINSNNIQNFINKINISIIKNESKYINTEYSLNNLRNIFSFIQGQNKFFADDILEGLIMKIFSFLIKKQDEKNQFLKQLSFKDKELFTSGNFQIIDLYDSNKFFPEELQDIKNLLEKEDQYEFEEDNNKNKLLQESPIYNLLNEIQNFKLKFHLENNKNIDKYIHNQYKNKKLIRLFLISTYIFYQNNFLSTISSNYDLTYSNLENIFSNYVFIPIKITPKISEISISHNNLGYNGLFNLAKSLTFNKNIERCNLNEANIRFYDLEYFHLGFALYNNYTLKELNLSFNKINKDVELFLAHLIPHLYGLKILNLSANNLKRGIASFFILIKELYCKNKTNLETLNLCKCELDNSSFYELGELLRSPFCRLKKLYLNRNIIQDSDIFLKKLKQNKSLEELYLNNTHINDNDIDNIIKIINNTNIRVLYLYKNLISNLDDLIKIIYTTRLLKFESEKEEFNETKGIIFKEQSFLENLDLSYNLIIHKNENGVKLLHDIKNQTNLSCLDISLILKGNEQTLFKASEENKKYTNAVEQLSSEIIKEKEEFINIKLIEKNANIDKMRETKNLKLIEENMLKIYDKKILDILKEKINEFNLEKELKQLVLKKEIKKKIFFLTEKNKTIKDLLIIKDGNNNGKTKINFENYKNFENYLFHNILLKHAEEQLKKIKENKIERKLFII